MNALSIDLTGALIALSTGVALVTAFRLIETHAAGSAAKKTRRLLETRSRARDGGEQGAADEA